MLVGSEDRGGGAAEEAGSPRSKVKFLCSHGGKILPRPSDGVLKYVGGETRVVAVARDISFSDLMKKLIELTESQIVLKYQIIAEDLDALVSVKSDEDLKHMIDEHDRHESAGIPKLRTFLFPAIPVILDNQLAQVEPQSIEQRYIEAINGILRISIKTRPSFSISACSSPKSESPDGNETGKPAETSFQNNGNHRLNRLYPMHKVQSSPSICSHQSSINQHLQPPRPHHNQHGYYQMPHQDYLTCRLRLVSPLDLHKGMGNERMPSGWALPVHGLNQLYTTTHTPSCGGGRFVGHEDGSHRGRASSVPQSPRNHGLRRQLSSHSQNTNL